MLYSIRLPGNGLCVSRATAPSRHCMTKLTIMIRAHRHTIKFQCYYAVYGTHRQSTTYVAYQMPSRMAKRGPTVGPHGSLSDKVRRGFSKGASAPERPMGFAGRSVLPRAHPGYSFAEQEASESPGNTCSLNIHHSYLAKNPS